MSFLPRVDSFLNRTNNVRNASTLSHLDGSLEGTGVRAQSSDSNNNSNLVDPSMKEFCLNFFPDVSNIIKPGEQCIYAASLADQIDRKDWLIVLCKNCYYKVNPVTKNVVLREEFSNLYSVEPELANQQVFKIFYYHTSADKKNEICTKSVSYVCAPKAGQLTRLEWLLVFNRLLQDYWQGLFEAQLIPPPDIYQFHVFLRKINHKGNEQHRCLVISTRSIFNLNLQPGERDLNIKKSKIKWEAPLYSLTRLVVYRQSFESFGFSLNKKLAGKINHEHFVFSCRDEKEKSFIVSELKNMFFTVAKRELVTDVLDGKADKTK